MSQSNDHIEKPARRSLLKGALLATAVPAGWLATSAEAAALVALTPDDPQGKALGYVTDASKVDAKANPTFKAGQHCASCAQFQGKPTDATAGCNIFPGKSVSAKGWCKVFAAKPAAK